MKAVVEGCVALSGRVGNVDLIFDVRGNYAWNINRVEKKSDLH